MALYPAPCLGVRGLCQPCTLRAMLGVVHRTLPLCGALQRLSTGLCVSWARTLLALRSLMRPMSSIQHV